MCCIGKGFLPVLQAVAWVRSASTIKVNKKCWKECAGSVVGRGYQTILFLPLNWLNFLHSLFRVWLVWYMMGITVLLFQFSFKCYDLKERKAYCSFVITFYFYIYVWNTASHIISVTRLLISYQKMMAIPLWWGYVESLVRKSSKEERERLVRKVSLAQCSLAVVPV